MDTITKGLDYYPIKITIERYDCVLTGFSPDVCRAARRVRDIVNAVWKDVKGG